MLKLSVVISAYNEEKNIVDCLSSVSWADEIILVNNTSQDKTVELAKKYTTNIFTRPNLLMLNINKNFGFSKARGKWILSLDADERVPKELKREIQSSIFSLQSSIDGYWIPRKNIIFGKWIKHGIWWPDYQLRLFKKGKGRFPEKHVHEYLEVSGKTEKLSNPMLHYNYTSICQFLYKMDKIYTENEAENIMKSGKRVIWQDALRMSVHDFLKTFFAQEGYRDGIHGLVLSLLQSFYALVVFAKVWERQGFKGEKEGDFLEETTEEFKRLGKEFKHWLLQSKLKAEKNFFKKIIRRLLK